MVFCRLLIFFSKLKFSKVSYSSSIRVSNSLYPYQARTFVRPCLGPNCMLKLSAIDTSRQRVIGQKCIADAKSADTGPSTVDDNYSPIGSRIYIYIYIVQVL